MKPKVDPSTGIAYGGKVKHFPPIVDIKQIQEQEQQEVNLSADISVPPEPTPTEPEVIVEEPKKKEVKRSKFNGKSTPSK